MISETHSCSSQVYLVLLGSKAFDCQKRTGVSPPRLAPPDPACTYTHPSSQDLMAEHKVKKLALVKSYVRSQARLSATAEPEAQRSPKE